MKFARVVYWMAAIWGFPVLGILLFMFDMIGKNDPPPITHPGFYYGFVTVGLAWQAAFVAIARDPVRMRPMMIPAVIEKFAYAIAMVVLYTQGRIKAPDLIFVAADTLLGVLFVAAYVKTKAAAALRATA